MTMPGIPSVPLLSSLRIRIDICALTSRLNFQGLIVALNELNSMLQNKSKNIKVCFSN